MWNMVIPFILQVNMATFQHDIKTNLLVNTISCFINMKFSSKQRQKCPSEGQNSPRNECRNHSLKLTFPQTWYYGKGTF